MKKIKLALCIFLSCTLAACGSSSAATSSTSAVEESTPAAAVRKEEKVSYDSEIVRFDVETDSIGTAELNAIVSVTNTGTENLYIGSNNKFAVNDASGHLVTSEDLLNICRNIIAPGETGYIYTFYASLPEGTDTSQQFTLKPELDVEEAYGDGITDYQVSDVGLSKDSIGFPEVTGRLTNDSDEEISYLYITAILKDADGTILGITGTSITEVQPGQQTTFQIDTLQNFSSEPASAEVVARKEHYQF